MPDQDDKILSLLEIPSSKEKGFEMLMNTYQKSMYRQIFGMTKNHDDTNDVLQNSFIKVWRYIDGFKRESKLSTWLYTIARNETLSFLTEKHKKNSITLSEKGQDIVFDGLKAEQYLEEENITKQLDEAIKTLPKLQKEVFMLRYYNEMKYTEMADLLNLTESTLKSSYHFAVKKIEAFLTEN